MNQKSSSPNFLEKKKAHQWERQNYKQEITKRLLEKYKPATVLAVTRLGKEDTKEKKVA